MTVATIPDVCVSMATMAASTAITTAIPTAVIMNESRRPNFSMLYKVPNDETRNQICRNPDIRSAMWYENPTDCWKLEDISQSRVVKGYRT